jgi:L-fuconolactonase
VFIFDAQLHVWRSSLPSFTPHRARGFSVEQAIRCMDDAGVDAAVLVPPTWDPDFNATAIEAAETHPSRFVVMGRVLLSREKPILPLPAGQVGYRLVLSMQPQRSQFLDGQADWFWDAAECAQIPVMVFAAGLMDSLREIIQKHPGLRLAIDHCGLPLNARGSQLMRTLEQVLRLSEYPNVVVKASALPSNSQASYPFADVHEIVYALVRAYGAERIFWGSDLTRLPCSYDEAVGMFASNLNSLSRQQIELVMGGALAAWLGWPTCSA